LVLVLVLVVLFSTPFTLVETSQTAHSLHPRKLIIFIPARLILCLVHSPSHPRHQPLLVRAHFLVLVLIRVHQFSPLSLSLPPFQRRVPLSLLLELL
ncbi:hypothetical protein OF83DRAFT_1157640, partial [Amylostereum chailletii]